MLVLFCRELTGGIRKHIVSILENYKLSASSVKLVTNIAEADSVFLEFIKKNPEFRNSILDLPIERSPHPSDLKILWQLNSALSPLRSRTVFHGHGAKGGVLARMLGKYMGAKTLYTPHGGSVHPMFGSLKNTIYMLIEKALYFMTDVLVFESNYSLKTYSERIYKQSEKFKLNCNGVSFTGEPIHRLLAQDPFVVGAFGALRSLKGFDLLIEAAANLSDLNIEVQIYGKGPEELRLQSLIREMNAPVKLMGETPAPLEEMRQCDLVVQPSRFESFGFTALEAISLGVPVIVSDAGGLVEVVEDNVSGLVFPVEDVEALSVKIRQMVEDSPGRKNMSREALRVSKDKFSEEAMLRGLSEIYGF